MNNLNLSIFYTMKRVTENKLYEAVEVQKRKIKELEDKLMETYILCKKLDEKNPDYKDKWVENYNIERAKTSIPPFTPIESQVEAYENLTLEYLVKEYPEFNEQVEKKLEQYNEVRETEDKNE